MKIFFTFLIFSFVQLSLFLIHLNAEEIVVTPSSGDTFILDVDSSTPFFEVLRQVQYYLTNSNINPEESINYDSHEISFSYTVGVPGIFAKNGMQKVLRNYDAPMLPDEKENIRFIIRSLAKHNWAQLAKAEPSLKRAGDQINHIHPFKFLECVFTDEELKVGLFVIRNKSLVWGDYYEGLKNSLEDESNALNLIQFTPQFAANVGINVNLILPYIQTRQWVALIDTLINNIPRQGNPDRYG